VKYHETGDMSARKGAGIGALVGGVIGILATRRSCVQAQRFPSKRRLSNDSSVACANR
jgi:hypothetical protein